MRAFPKRLADLAKFAEIGQLATGIIHEINNPVTCLQANVDRLLQEFPRITAVALEGVGTGRRAKGRSRRPPAGETEALLQRVHESLENLAISAELITSITKNLRSLAYSAYDAPKQTDLHACIEAALRVSGHELEPRVRVEKDFGSLPRLIAYPGLLTQVFLNLFLNAAQSIAGEGVLRIRTRRGADGVSVEVGDTGRGIAPEHLGKIFRPFFTTKPLGVGLGLSICKGIIDRHGGTLEVSSPPGRGTVFRIGLPREVGRRAGSAVRRSGPEGTGRAA